MSNMVLSGEDLQRVIREAAHLVSSTAGVTLGPEGRPVILGKSFGAPYVTKDGHSVVSALKPSCRKVAGISEVLKQAAMRANDESGDGTTTASVFAGALLDDAYKHIAAGRSRAKLRAGMERAKDAVVEYVNNLSRKVSSDEEIAQVGTISANGDAAIGRKISEAMSKVGKEGVITVEEGKGLDEFSVSVVKGMVFDRGYLSPYFVTNSEKGIVEFDNPYILILNKKLSNIQTMVSLLESVLRSSRPLLVIAEDVEGEALTAFVLNRLRSGLKVAAVKAPGFGNKRAEMLEDIRVLTGTKHVISDDIGIKMEDVQLSDLGSAKTVVVTKDETTIVDGEGSKSNVDARVQYIRDQISESKSDYDREKLQERLAKLVGGVAVLRVGGATEVEVKERKDRVDDALHSTRAAVEEGIVPGGGATLLYAVKALDGLSSDDDDESAGISIVREALKSPICKIVDNASGSSQVVVNKLLSDFNPDVIFDVRSMDYVDAFAKGIIDPAKVVRVAIEAAVSVVSVLITVEAFIVDLPDDDNSNSSPQAAGGMPMGAGMGGF